MSPVSCLLGPDRDERATAILSPDRRYRYALERRWGRGQFVLFVGLNPSTADENTDDATIRRCMGFAKRWGAGGMLMGNLYALRSTDPRALLSAEDPIGPDNDVWLTTMSIRSMITVCAWGANSFVTKQRVDDVIAVLDGQVSCFGYTAAGHPKHPVRLANKTPIEIYHP